MSTKTSGYKHLLSAGACAAALLTAVPGARADVIFTLGNNPQPDEVNILFSASETGNPITGEVDHAGIGVEFKSLTQETLYQKAKGQAIVENAADPNKAPLTSMNVSVPGYGFGDFILNLENGTGTAHVVATDNFDQTFDYDLGNGQNFLTLTTKNDEFITNIAITGTDSTFGFLQFKQPRISELCTLGTGGSCAPIKIPEPSSIAMLGSSLLLAGVVLRRRKRTKAD